MENNFYDNLIFIKTGEWYLLLFSFSLLLFRKQTLDAFENFSRLINYLLVSLSAVISFILEALFVFGGQIGMRGGYYVHILYAHHLLPWVLFMFLVDMVLYLFTMIIAIIQNAYLWGKAGIKEKVALSPKKREIFVLSPNRLVLLQ
ncbi:MAG: hypothetical protein ACOX2Y_04980 [Christensenellales bacterium]